MARKVIILLLLLPFACSDGLAQSKLFWLDNDTGSPDLGSEQPPRIRSVRLDGTHVETIDQIGLATGMAFDHTTGFMYWTQLPLGHGVYGDMWRFDASAGGSSENVLETGWTEGGLAIDHEEGKVYWATRVRDMNMITIMRANLDGSAPEEVAPDVSSTCRGLAVDPVGRHAYWTTDDTIYRVDIDAGVVEDVGPNPQAPPYPSFGAGIAIDPGAEKMYWIRRGNRSLTGLMGVFRANLDGSDIEKLWEETYSDAYDIVVDGVNKYVYWSQWTYAYGDYPRGVQIRRARFDEPITFGNIETLAGPPDTPSDIPSWLDLFVDPGSPQHVSPPNASEDVLTTVRLSWNRVECSPRYDVQVAADSTFSSIVFRENTPHNEAIFVAPVAEHRYWWRVHSNACGLASHWSTPWWFRVGGSGSLAPTLTSPDEGATTGTTVTFSWTPGLDAKLHTFQLATSPGFVTPIVNSDSLTVSEITATDLTPGETYYWRVAGTDDDGRYTFAVPRSFTVATKPVAVTLLQPEDEQIEVPAYTVFEWEAAEGADSYHFELSNETDFASIVVDLTTADTSYELAAPLAYGAVHHWRVCGVNLSGEGPWTARSFTVAVGTAVDPPETIPETTSLSGPYPNPSSSIVYLPLAVADRVRIRIEVFDLLGRHVTTLLDEIRAPGRFTEDLAVDRMSTGTYIAVLTAGESQSRVLFTVAR